MNFVSQIIDYESGKLGLNDTLRLFSKLIQSGQAWSLQGSYGRTAKDLIEQGWISPKGKILKFKKEESAEEKPRKIEELQALASDKIGDDKKPNLFFVSDNGTIVTVTSVFQVAYAHWLTISENEDRETALEDRLTGVLASVQPTSEDDPTLQRLDDTSYFKYR